MRVGEETDVPGSMRCWVGAVCSGNNAQSVGSGLGTSKCSAIFTLPLLFGIPFLNQQKQKETSRGHLAHLSASEKAQVEIIPDGAWVGMETGRYHVFCSKIFINKAISNI